MHGQDFEMTELEINQLIEGILQQSFYFSQKTFWLNNQQILAHP